jgi:hypothetical protein
MVRDGRLRDGKSIAGFFMWQRMKTGDATAEGDEADSTGGMANIAASQRTGGSS